MNEIKINQLIKNNFLDGFLSSRKIINPKREWILLLAFFTILAVSSVVFDFVMYQKISSGEMYISIDRSELNIEVLKTDELKKLINDFEARKVMVASLKTENLVDPSI